MSLLHRQDLPRCFRQVQNIVRPVGRRIRCPIKKVCAEQRIVFRKGMVDSSREEIFVYNLLPGEVVDAGVRVQKATVWQVVESQVRRRTRIHRHLAGRQQAISCIFRRHKCFRGYPL